MNIKLGEIAGLLKRAADRISELEKSAEDRQKESSADEVIKNMVAHGLITEKQAELKKKEILRENNMDFYKKALELYSGHPPAIGIPSGSVKSGNPLDSWVYGS